MLKNKVYIVHDDYQPEPGTIIYGAFPTVELAKACIEYLQGPDSPFGEGHCDNVDWQELTVTDDPTYV